MEIHVGSFYTIDTPYEKVIKDYLVTSCTKLGIVPLIGHVENSQDWTKNVAQKPRVILEMLENHIENGDMLFFVDADATIEKYPSSLKEIDSSYEIGFHTLNWNDFYGYTAPTPVMELLTGTMFFRNTELVRNLCKEWYEKAVQSSQWEQKVLQSILPKYPDLKVYHLPLEYCYVTTLPNGEEPKIKCDPIVKHYQASRTLKRKLK